MKKKLIAGALALGMVVLSLTACGGSASNTAAPAAEEETKEEDT